ncbi:MAG: hypothetical protein EB121_05280, partial [Alphaproteobacteria bacterium]|nr:hypothetical protein [Alphaproteobacteria bacterium]
MIVTFQDAIDMGTVPEGMTEMEWRSMSGIAPNLPQVIAQNQAAGESWLETGQKIISGLVMSEQALKWFTSITSYSLAKEQLQKTGRYTPPYATNPTGTPRSQVPGIP